MAQAADALRSFPPLFGARRALSCAAPEPLKFTAADGTELLLHRVQSGDRGPVVLSPGTAMTALSYCVDSVRLNFVEFLAGQGFDVWLFDWRTSPLLASHRRAYTLADVARYDWPAAVAEVRRRTGAAQVAILAHCLSAPALLLSLVGGHLERAAVRAIVASQVALHLRFTLSGTLKVRLRLDRLMPGSDMIHQRPQDVGFRVGDLAASTLARLLPTRFICGNPACYRHAATFGELILHARVDSGTHAIMGELVPECLAGFLKDVAVRARQDSILSGEDRLHLDRLALPIHFISGAENGMFVPESTRASYDLLCEANGRGHYRRSVYSGYGHLDCFLGQGAAETIWPDLALTLGTGTPAAGTLGTGTTVPPPAVFA